MTKLPRTTRRLGLVALAAMPMLGALALSSTTAVAASATAKKSSSSSSVVSSQSVSASVQAQTLAYWTQARRDAAQSVNVVAGAQAPSSHPAGGPDGPPRSEAGSSPAGVSSESSGVSSASQTTGPVLTAQPWSYPFPYDAFGVPTTSYKKYPVQGERHDILRQQWGRRLQMLRHVGGQWAQLRRCGHRGTLRGQH